MSDHIDDSDDAPNLAASAALPRLRVRTSEERTAMSEHIDDTDICEDCNDRHGSDGCANVWVFDGRVTPGELVDRIAYRLSPGRHPSTVEWAYRESPEAGA